MSLLDGLSGLILLIDGGADAGADSIALDANGIENTLKLCSDRLLAMTKPFASFLGGRPRKILQRLQLDALGGQFLDIAVVPCSLELEFSGFHRLEVIEL